jgi:hypothetical protein
VHASVPEAHEEAGRERLLLSRAVRADEVLVEMSVGPAELELVDGLVGEAVALRRNTSSSCRVTRR